ncbi:MAG: SSI family serine proteinase inhibitor [Candidatus Nanopelagicales bacterium]
MVARRIFLTVAALALLGGMLAGGVSRFMSTAAAQAMSLHPQTIRLTVHVDAGNDVWHKWTLNCRPSTDSTLPDTAAACKFLAKSGRSVLAPDPRTWMCSMIYGGPQRAKIYGTWGGKWVSENFRRTNGCEVARWQRLVVLLGTPWITSSASPGPGSSLVRGRVSLGPTCPVQQAGQTCEQPSIDALVTFSNGSDTATARASTAGGFQIALADGVWQATASAGMRCPVVPVAVPTSAEVVIACDTGIR